MNRGPTGAGRACLLTGATGFLGSHIMAGLLKKGERVVVVGRAAGGESLAERIRRLLRWFAIEHLEKQLECLEADFLKPGLGLGAGEYERLRRLGLPIIHGASDTRFAEKSRDAVLAANVGSLAEILDLARRSRARRFCLLSSAYAAGIGDGACPEAPVRSQRFNNVYEESKALAENRVLAACRQEGIPCTIVRPAIVYGDAQTGRSLKFNALYHPVRSLLQLRDIYVNDIRKNDGKKAAAFGIHPAAFLAILERPASETFFHIASQRPAGMAQLAAFSGRFLGLAGIEVVVGAAGAEAMRNPPEELFDLFIRPYRPYIADRRDFALENADQATGGSLPPDFSYEIFQRCMAFAVAADWGKKLF